MTQKQCNEIKGTFGSLEQMISQSTTAEGLVKTPGFSELFAKAYKCLGVLEKEWISDVPGSFNSRDAILSVIERIEVVQFGVEKGLAAEAGDMLLQNLKDAKAILTDVNKNLNS